MSKIAFEYIEKGEYAPREGYPVVERDNVAAVIQYRDEFLLLQFNNVNYSKCLVTGGIEKGENKIEAVKREVIEETGYTDIESIKPVDCVNRSMFFVEHKNQNRCATYYPFLVLLKSKNRTSITDEEANEHTCLWYKECELDSVEMFENHRKMLLAAKNMRK